MTILAPLSRDVIELCRIGRSPDPCQIIASVAKQRGVRITSSIRWRGAIGPAYLDAELSDGAVVRVYLR